MAPRHTNRSNSFEDGNSRKQHRTSYGSDADSSYRQGRSVGRAQERNTRAPHSTDNSHVRTSRYAAQRGAQHSSRDGRASRDVHSSREAHAQRSSASRNHGVNNQFDPTSERYERNAARSAHATTNEHRFFSPYHILIACAIVVVAIIIVAVMINGPRENTPQEDATPNYVENVSYTPHSTDLDTAPAATDSIERFH